jgi:hypothetical protein
MFKLTALLCLGMFATMMVGGEDRGQLRPGLAQAALDAAQNPAPEAPVEPEPALVAAAPAAAAPADLAPAATPVVVEQAAAPVENATDPVFSLATYGDDAAAPATAETTTPVEGALAYISGRSVNVR